jgi:hypothetical protein
MYSFSVLANKHLNWSSEKENEKKKGKKSKVISTTDVGRRIYERESESLYPSSPFSSPLVNRPFQIFNDDTIFINDDAHNVKKGCFTVN